MEDITFSEIISYAKIAEENAKKFYLDAARNAKNSNVREYLESLAEEEQGHIERLDALLARVQENGTVPSVGEEVKTLGYDDLVKGASIDEDATYKEVLEAAIVKEKEAASAYDKFARYIDDTDAAKLFRLLAEEERKHLKRFEEEYDDLQNQNY